MSIDPSLMNDGTATGANHLLARGAADDVCADRRVTAAINDFFVDEKVRLDDRVRAGLTEALASLTSAIEGELRQYAARLLIGRDEPELAKRLASDPPMVHAALNTAGLLRDADLMRELLARVRQEILGEALSPAAPNDPDTPSLIARLVGSPDGIVAAAATGLLAADSRRRAAIEPGGAPRSDLPAELHHRLVWWSAAALRSLIPSPPSPALDRALTEAALRSLAAHDEGDRLEAAALRLAAAIAAQPHELPGFLVEALGDRRVAMFVALLAQALGFSYDLARDIVLDPVADRLWLVLRAVALERAPIAAIGLALCEADPRRDVEAFADQIDAIMAVTPEAARQALSSLSLHPDFRQALLVLAKARPA
ncbi:DUF2336 domain-containing protein [Sphingomonas sp. 28-63-12]|uniref:DUF2336 domain-containing protein n=1 Tax=Sphingomonas sp. 28-63-12 TaxID=1970434 RepID=UPI000BDCDA63|nr:MAG: hypothetical protein B7Y47_12850 [Sphingomonas sp. 28-63-12]